MSNVGHQLININTPAQNKADNSPATKKPKTVSLIRSSLGNLHCRVVNVGHRRNISYLKFNPQLGSPIWSQWPLQSSTIERLLWPYLVPKLSGILVI